MSAIPAFKPFEECPNPECCAAAYLVKEPIKQEETSSFWNIKMFRHYYLCPSCSLRFTIPDGAVLDYVLNLRAIPLDTQVKTLK